MFARSPAWHRFTDGYEKSLSSSLNRLLHLTIRQSGVGNHQVPKSPPAELFRNGHFVLTQLPPACLFDPFKIAYSTPDPSSINILVPTLANLLFPQTASEELITENTSTNKLSKR